MDEKEKIPTGQETEQEDEIDVIGNLKAEIESLKKNSK